MSTAIKVENVSKAYMLGQISTGTLSRDIERWWALARGKEDPFLKIGETNDRTQKGNSDVVWSLKDVNFEIEQGTAVGIVGKNGAGKSTLLKILSQVTSPTTGRIGIKGRIASLLEVGTGFHPELTGRENIFLNGAMLGMRKKEILRKFDEIVSFAGVERYIDTPVKRYSSGMYVRLAFAVAAHLESEILIVDEVLAVGDAEFQKKCLGKMGEVSSGQGRTVLFVSHNINAVKQLCTRGLFLENGMVKMEGKVTDVIEAYSNKIATQNDFNPIKIQEIGVVVTNIFLNRKNEGVVNPCEPLEIEIELESDRDIEKIGIQIMISHDDVSGSVFESNSKTIKNLDLIVKKGKNKATCLIHNFNLCSGNYWLGFGMDMPFVLMYYREPYVMRFEVPELMLPPRLLTTSSVYGHIFFDHDWSISYGD